MLLDWTNIKYVNGSGKIVMVRANKATPSQKVMFYLEAGYSFDKALIEAKSDRSKDMVIAPLTFVW